MVLKNLLKIEIQEPVSCKLKQKSLKRVYLSISTFAIFCLYT